MAYLPQIHSTQLAARLAAGALLVDVREAIELQQASFPLPHVHLPLSILARDLFDALPPELQDKDREIIVACHHGQRSAQVTAWLRQNGWINVHNLVGGIDAYAAEVDSSVPYY